MKKIITDSSIYCIDAATGDIIDLPEKTGRPFKKKLPIYTPTAEDIQMEKDFVERTKEKHFLAWLEDEHYRVAHEYRVALIKEIVGAKKVCADISKDLAIIMAALKEIKVPPYNNFEGTLEKAKQLKFYNQMSKPDFTQIFHETIKNNLQC